MATDEYEARMDDALAELMQALTPRIEAAAPVGRPGGWPEEYRYRDGGSAYSFYHLGDPRFALRIVIENPSRFGVVDPQALSNAARRVVQALQQRSTPNSAPGAVASLLVAAIGDLYAALGMRDAAERHSQLAQSATEPPAADAGGEPPIVTRWKGKLLDLSRKNPLLAISNRGVPLLVDESTLPDIEDVVADGVPIVIRGSEDLDELDLPSWARHATDLDSETVLSLLSDEGIVFARDDTRVLTRELPGLRRRAQVAREESGASPLYLTLGGLQIMDEIAPLFLLPVTLEGSRRGP